MRYNREVLPPSVLPHPIPFAPESPARLVLERVIPYRDGFELEITRDGEVTDPVEASIEERSRGRKRDPSGRPECFGDLGLEIAMADARRTSVSDLNAAEVDGPLVVSRFWRRGSDERHLWVWVMPLPPSGPVQITLHEHSEHTSASVVIAGELVRPV